MPMPSAVRVAARFLQALSTSEFLQQRIEPLFAEWDDPEEVEWVVEELAEWLDGAVQDAAAEVVTTALNAGKLVEFKQGGSDNNGQYSDGYDQGSDYYTSYWYEVSYPTEATLKGVGTFDLAPVVRAFTQEAKRNWRGVSPRAVTSMFANPDLLKRLVLMFQQAVPDLPVELSSATIERIEEAFDNNSDIDTSTTEFSPQHPDGEPAAEGPGVYLEWYVDTRKMVPAAKRAKLQGTKIVVEITTPVKPSYQGAKFGFELRYWSRSS